MRLYRPVGLEELLLIYKAGMRAFPPRLAGQPIFYPVVHLAYAQQIARDWNTRSGTFGGYVTRFTVDDAHGAQFPAKQVGAAEHVELWVPAESLEEFNQHLVGPIELVDAYFGEGFLGSVPASGALAGQSASEQMTTLHGLLDRDREAFRAEAMAQHAAMFANYPYWERGDFTRASIDEARRDHVLAQLAAVWAGEFEAAAS
jgi:hypothetical protein